MKSEIQRADEAAHSSTVFDGVIKFEEGSKASADKAQLPFRRAK